MSTITGWTTGSSSPVLTATHHSHGSLAWLSGFFPRQPWRSYAPTNLHAKWLKRCGSTQGCAFWSRNHYFSCPLITRYPKRSKFGKILNLENFRSIWRLTLEVPSVNTPYSSSKPNKSGTVNRQIGDEKLKYVLKFCTGGTSRDIAHVQWRLSMFLCMHEVWGVISRKL